MRAMQLRSEGARGQLRLLKKAAGQIRGCEARGHEADARARGPITRAREQGIRVGQRPCGVRTSVPRVACGQRLACSRAHARAGGLTAVPTQLAVGMDAGTNTWARLGRRARRCFAAPNPRSRWAVTSSACPHNCRSETTRRYSCGAARAARVGMRPTPGYCYTSHTAVATMPTRHHWHCHCH